MRHSTSNDQTFEPKSEADDWPEPSTLPALTAPVPELPENLLPEPLRPWLCDIAERIQIPLDFVAAPAIVGLASLVGRSVGIHPKRKDDWLVVPNLWGMIIARPSLLKSPAMAQALTPIKRLAALASEGFRDGVAAGDAHKDILDMKIAALKDRGRTAAKKDDDASLSEIQSAMAELRGQQEQADAKERRYIVNDGTVEKIGELLNQNPRGLLISRDELSGLLLTLDKPGREGDREFYLESWNGDANFTGGLK